ncbi:hypothetical protein U370_01995 [Anaplasma marginale str. Dawn]|uniref:Uncharacterized protein n=3 Tax=Anaplasmataceae TaxID=942 RepID=D1AS71_ANACI|nr:hypothetical protein AM529 [Anaplasma marginale str. St. Maries]ACZ49324.1 hypothetical protein ACIS_00774 [Anaplasma centrale str. Israel]AGZ78800.1 hypothetical protein U128_02040 [Anaplasma marginale str. Gypsy Plains]AGZ79633.1 hypothetical protein U370_01995 [Anaplasma marginale str. Dawn]AXW84000.1 hypothetical protein CQZ76_02035 [Anaplasma marginale]
MHASEGIMNSYESNDRYDDIESIIREYLGNRMLTSCVAAALLNTLLLHAICYLLFVNRANISKELGVVLLRPFAALVMIAAMHVASMILARPSLLFFRHKNRRALRIYSVGAEWNKSFGRSV